MRTAAEILAFIDRTKSASRPGDMGITPGERGAIIGALNKMLGEDNRRELCNRLFHKRSTKEMTPGEWYALACWVGLLNVDGKWRPQPDFYDEAMAILEMPEKTIKQSTTREKDAKPRFTCD